MPRRKLSEYHAKQAITKKLGIPFVGYAIDARKPLDDQLAPVATDVGTFVVKVDQGIKGRFKQGLVLLDVPHEGLASAVRQLAQRGYDWVFVEPMVAHDATDERYLSLTRSRQGVVLRYSQIGGVDIEQSPDQIQSVLLSEQTAWTSLARKLAWPAVSLQALHSTFQTEHLTFLEINPYVSTAAGLALLDLAIEIDDAGLSATSSWNKEQFRETSNRQLTAEEQSVRQLSENSPASFNLSVINPDGGVFLLLSGGGASIVVADEVYNQGYGKLLANYGEYSGNPNTNETQQYATAVLDLLVQSKAPRKVLFIGGAVANFTDVNATFKGVIAALYDKSHQLQEQGVRVFVRRGGPNQEAGLARMEATLRELGLYGNVSDANVPIGTAVTNALEELKK
jgi:ATP-citrate lyase beta-subunit